MLDNILEKKDVLKRLCQKNGISYLGLFGSYARGEATLGSDADFLINFKKGSVPSLFKYFDIERDFVHELGVEVDLVQEGALKERVRPYVYRDLKTIYDERQ